MFKKIISGFGLIEVMIAASILAIGLLGAASIQSQSLNVTRDSGSQEISTRMLNGLSNFILIMQVSEIQSMLLNTSTFSSTRILSTQCNFPSNCTTPSDLYASLFSGWRVAVNNLLPNGLGCVCHYTISANGITDTFIRVAVAWKNLSGADRQDSLDSQVASSSPITLDSRFQCTSVNTTPNNVGCSFAVFPIQ